MELDEFKKLFLDTMTRYSPFYALLQKGDAEPEGFRFTGKMFGGELLVDDALVRIKGKEIQALNHEMQLKALALQLNRLCVLGDKDFGFMKLPRGGQTKVRLEHLYDAHGNQIVDRHHRELELPEKLPVWLSPPSINAVGYGVAYGFQIDCSVWRA